MNTSLRTQDLLAIGLMTFALFLGAGNLIFPPSMGLEAGTNLLPAMMGFLVTAVGLPAFTLIVLGRITTTNNLTKALPSWLGKVFWVLLFTSIGPAFGMPRAVTVAYEMGIKPFVEGDHLLLFTIIFCGVTLLLAFTPGKLVDYIGKVMTPALILMLVALSVAAIMSPLGVPQLPSADYQNSAVTHGLIQGYMTMDGIAAVGFGWVIIQAINAKGVTEPKEVARVSIYVAAIYAVLMGACYLAMGYVGATSSTVAASAANGGEILTLYVHGIFGEYGQLLLAAIIIMACLTTTVGLTNASAEYYRASFKAPFALTSVVVVSLTCVIANFGLAQIIKVSLPAILLLCPVAIALVMASFVGTLNKRFKPSHVSVLVVTLAFGSLDALAILDMMPGNFNTQLQESLPLYSAHASWLVPCLLVLTFNSLRSVISQRKNCEPVEA
ncbi:branched-chain amino acid transporter [Photobacterium jeanii]|uniref:Branched-chain amino acid transport system carrier protein n=1 Tax=Photobacterium jeanii TaxID=858640 RepID=A0A178K348_9GAMM|nr:branched-chain amino acid transport system II carrier protein [Photobacterium jeanii]OAN11526.1 branched-chain amino acid transporter [Photobacterium jeanii]PST91044.1 branched-chain amino acid transport system II carrier protein [Photobacterium jeanii]